MKHMLCLPEIAAPRRRLGDPLTDALASQMRALIVSPKEQIKRHLNEQKDNARFPTISENDLINAIDTLKGALGSDKETEDLFYALSDLCPHESVKRKVVEALRK